MYKIKPTYMLPMSLTSFQIKKCAQTENVEWGKDIHWKWKRKTKKYGADTCIKQTDFKTKTATRDKARHYIIKGSIQQEYIIFVNIYVPNTEATKCLTNLTELKEETNSSTIVVEDFNTPLTPRNRLSRQKKKRKHWSLTTH